MLAEPCYDRATGLIGTLEPVEFFGGGQLVLCVQKAHLLPLRLEAPRVLGLEMTLEMGPKEGA